MPPLAPLRAAEWSDPRYGARRPRRERRRKPRSRRESCNHRKSPLGCETAREEAHRFHEGTHRAASKRSRARAGRSRLPHPECGRFSGLAERTMKTAHPLFDETPRDDGVCQRHSKKFPEHLLYTIAHDEASRANLRGPGVDFCARCRTYTASMRALASPEVSAAKWQCCAG